MVVLYDSSSTQRHIQIPTCIYMILSLHDDTNTSAYVPPVYIKIDETKDLCEEKMVIFQLANESAKVPQSGRWIAKRVCCGK